MNQSPNDPRAYQQLELDNGLKVLLVHQADTPKASAALAVRVGHFDDPPHRQGLAHFLEHMLFLGTDRFPEPDAYPQFISQHGGRNNAWTGTEFTNYFFDIDPAHLSAALERFSRFFVAPLLSPKYVDKERNAVNSEYQLKLRDAMRRRYQVHKETVNPAHPFSKFSVGSLDTLADLAQSTLHQDVSEFYQSHYSANIMRLVLLGPQPLEQLAEWARDYFSAIPDLAVGKQLPDVPLYTPDNLGIVVRMKPLKETRRLTITFPFGEQLSQFRAKPLSFLAHLLGWEGDGSLLALLKKQGLANSLSVGGGVGGYNFKDFSLTVGVTAAGVERYDEILQHLFEFVALLRQSGYDKQLYDDRALLNSLNFRFQEKSDAMDWASHLAVNMHHYPDDELLSADYSMTGLDEQVFEGLLAQLTPERMRIGLVSPEQKTDRTARWYFTEYAVEPVEPELLARLGQACPHPQMRMPQANPWLPAELTVWPQSGLEHPEQLARRPDLSAWWLGDDTFNVPRGYLNLSLHAAGASETAHSQVCSRMLVDLISDRLHQSLYAAEVAGFHYKLQSGLHGMGCQITGYSQHQVELLSKVLETLRQGEFAAERFADLRDRQLQVWENAQKERPLTRLIQSHSVLLYQSRFSPHILADNLKILTPEQLREYADNWYQTLHVQGLAVGNWRKQDMQQLGACIDAQLLSFSSPQEICGRQLSAFPHSGAHYSLDSEHGDSALVFYWQAENSSHQLQAFFALASQLMGPVFFHQLRTEQQLGYQLGVSFFPVAGYAGLLAYLQSPVAGPEAAYLAFTAFFERFGREFDSIVSDEQFSQQKQALLAQLNEPDPNLAMRTQRLWISLQNGDFKFEQREKLTAALESLERAEFTAQLQQLLLDPERKPLILSCRGTSHQDQPELGRGERVSQEQLGERISDLGVYKQGLGRLKLD